MAPSGLVAPPAYDSTITTVELDTENAPSGLPPFGTTLAPPAAAAPAEQYEQYAQYAPEPQYETAPAFVPQYSAAFAPAETPGQYGAAVVAINTPVAGQYTAAPAARYAPTPTSFTPQYGAPTESPYNAPYGTTPAVFAAPTPEFNAPAPPQYGQYQAAPTPARSTGNVLSIASVALAVFAMIAGVFAVLGVLGNPFLAAAGAVVCGAIGQRRGERLAKLGLILGIVATVLSLGLLILSLVVILL